MTDIEHLARLNELENRIIILERTIKEIQKQLSEVSNTAQQAQRNSAGNQIIGGPIRRSKHNNGVIGVCPVKLDARMRHTGLATQP